MSGRRVARLGIFGLVLGGALGAGLLPGRTAITTPAPGSTVRGDVTITEDRGGQNSFPCSGADSWIEVYRPDGSLIFSRNKGDAGGWSTVWVTHGEAIGAGYRIRSWRKDRFFSWTSCKDGIATLSDFTVTLENLSAISYTSGMTSAYYGEAFGVSANLRDAVTGRGIGGRTVTFDLGGVVASCVTDASGNCATSLTASVTPGSYTLVTSFGGDCCWRGSSVGVGFSVLRRPTSSTYTGATSVYSQEAATVSGRLVDVRNGAGVGGRTLVFELLSGSTVVRSVTATTDGAGNASASMTFDVAAGSYTVRGRFGGDAFFDASTSPGVGLSVLARPTAVSYTGDTSGFWNESATVSARLTDSRLGGAPLAGKTITFTLGSASAPAVTDATGTATATIPLSQTPGSYTVTASFAGDSVYAGASGSAPFAINKRPTALAYSGDLSGYWQETATVHATLTDVRSGGGLGGKTITFTLGSGSATATTDASGVATATLPLAQSPGTYTVSASFGGDAFYVGSGDSKAFSILKRPTIVVYEGDTSGYWDEPASLRARLVDVRAGGGVGGKSVSFTLGTAGTSAVTDASGLASSTLHLAQVPGSYTVAAAFAEDAFYLGSAAARPFEILKRPTRVDYSGDGSGYWDEDAALSARLVDLRRASGVAGKAIAFTLGSASASATTGSDGLATASVHLAQVPGSYTVSSAFAGDAFYVASSVDAPFDILRRPTALTYIGDTSGYWDEDANLQARLVDVRRASGLGGFSVAFTLGSASASAVTSADGVATATVHLAQVPDTYSVQATYSGDPYYVGSSDAHAFDILRRPTHLTYTGDTSGYWDEDATLSATLIDLRRGSGLGGFPVTLSLGSASATLSTGPTGQISQVLHLDQIPGAYTASAAFAGDPYYVPSEDSAAFEILRRPTRMVYGGDTSGFWDEDATLSATLIDVRRDRGLGGFRIGFSLGTATASAETGPEGTASTVIHLAQVPDRYPARAVFGGDAYYVESSVDASFEILRRPTHLTYTGDTSGYWDEDATLQARLVDVRRGSGLGGHLVTLSLGSFSATVTSDATGQVVQVLHLSQTPAAYTAAAAFAGDPYYVASADSAAFEILRRPTALRYTGATSGRRGHTVTLSAELTDVRAAGGLAGFPVTFTLGSFERTVPTDDEGVATVDVVLDQEPGSYVVRAAYGGDPYYVPSSVEAGFSLEWEFTFVDDLSRGTVFLNPFTREFRVQTPEGQTAIKHDPDMQVIALPIPRRLTIQPPAPPGPPALCVENPLTGERVCLPSGPPSPGSPPVVCVENPLTGERVCTGQRQPQGAARPCVEDPATGERHCPPEPPPPPRCVEDPSSGERHCAPRPGEEPPLGKDTACDAYALAPFPSVPGLAKPQADCVDAVALVVFADDEVRMLGAFSLRTGTFLAAGTAPFGSGIFELHSPGSDVPGCVEDPATGERVCLPDRLPEPPSPPSPPPAPAPPSAPPPPGLPCVEDPMTGKRICVPEA